MKGYSPCNFLSSLFFLCLVAFTLPNFSLAATNFENERFFISNVDFCSQMLTGFGIAGTPWETKVSPEEERARAWMDALHHAYELILKTPLMEGIKVEDAIQRNPALKMKLGHVILSGKKKIFDPDVSGFYRCQVKIPLFGPMSLRSALYLGALYPPPTAFAPSKAAVASHAIEIMSRIKSKGLTASNSVFLRAVIDVRGTYFEPSLFPRFFSETGELLFQEAQIRDFHRFSRPLVRFSENALDASANIDPAKVLFIDGFVTALSKSDLTIHASDVESFQFFCKHLESVPTWSGEILVIFDREKPESGALPKAASQKKSLNEEKKPGGALE